MQISQLIVNGIYAGVLIATLGCAFSLVWVGARFFVFTFGSQLRVSWLCHAGG